MAQHQPHGSAAENNFPCTLNQPFVNLPKQRCIFMQHKIHQNHPKSLPLRPDFSSTRGWPPNSKGSQCVDLLSSSCTNVMVKQFCGNRRLVAVDDEQGSNGYLLKLSYPICLDRTLFDESFHVTHATSSTVCQKIPSLKKVSPLCRLLQPRNECEPHQSPSGWRWSIPGRWVVFFDALNHHDGIEGMKLWLWWGWNFPHSLRFGPASNRS